MNKNKAVRRMLLGIAILVGGVLASGFVISSAQAAGRDQLPYPPDGSHIGTMDGGEYRGYETSPTMGVTGTVPYRATGCPGMGGRGWAWPSPNRSSRPTAAASGSRAGSVSALPSSSPCLSRTVWPVLPWMLGLRQAKAARADMDSLIIYTQPT